MKVLLLIDIQNDFCPGGALAVPEGDQVVGIANRLMKSGSYDLVVATKDWHPADHVSFADNHSGKSVFERIETQKGPQTLWPRHCVQGTPGAELHPELDAHHIDEIIPKGTDPLIDSYSGFFDNNHEKETLLRRALEVAVRRLGGTPRDIELTVCGLALDYCVAATVRDAVQLGFRTEVVVDGCRSVNLNAGDDVKTLRELSALGVALKHSVDIVPAQERPRSIGLMR